MRNQVVINSGQNDEDDDDDYVAGSMAILEETKNFPLKVSDMNIYSSLFSIPITYSIPMTNSNQNTQYLIIDSDAKTERSLLRYSGRDNVEFIFESKQGQTASCGDNALITSLKARAAGFNVSILIQNNHACV